MLQNVLLREACVAAPQSSRFGDVPTRRPADGGGAGCVPVCVPNFCFSHAPAPITDSHCLEPGLLPEVGDGIRHQQAFFISNPLLLEIQTSVRARSPDHYLPV